MSSFTITETQYGASTPTQSGTITGSGTEVQTVFDASLAVPGSVVPLTTDLAGVDQVTWFNIALWIPASNATVIAYQTSNFIPPPKPKPISIAPIKRLPMPPQDYDQSWVQNNQDAILSHLNDTLSSSRANPQVLLRDTETGLTHAVEISNGQIKITPVR